MLQAHRLGFEACQRPACHALESFSEEQLLVSGGSVER